MRKSFVFYFTLVLFSVLILSCKEKEKAPSSPAVTIEEGESGITSVSFRIIVENASDAAYWVYESDATYTPQAGDVFSKGTRIPVDEPSDCVVSDLAPNTSYTVAAVAKNINGEYSEMATIDMVTSPSEGLYSFEVTLGEPEDVAIEVKVVPSDENASYVVDIVEGDTYAGIASSDIHAEYLRIFEGLASNEGRTLEEILSEKLFKGTYEGRIDGLVPLSSYEVVVFGMDPVKGFLTSEVTVIPFQTAEQILTLDVRVENLTATSADVYVIPSNDEDSFVWLCEPTAKYPDMSLEEIAYMYTDGYSYLFDQGMGLYWGPQEYPGYEIMPGVSYYILAYGYEMGVGISTDVVGQFFDAPEGGNIEEFQAEIRITDTQGQRIDYDVIPNDETIYYLPGCMKTSEYSDEFVKTDVENYIKEYWEGNKEWNPSYSIEEAVNVLCYMGTQSLYASPLEANTDYTVFVVPVNSKGETGSVVISVEESTEDLGYSDANVTSEYLGAWDAKMLQDAGYFTGEYLNDKYIMAFKINASPTCDTLKIKAWNGYTELTDQELIDFIEPYWDAIYAGDEIDNHQYIYTTTSAYYAGAMTFCTLGVNSEGVRAEMGRTYVDLFYEDALLSLDEWESLQASASSVPEKVVYPAAKSASAAGPAQVSVFYFPKTVKQ